MNALAPKLPYHPFAIAFPSHSSVFGDALQFGSNIADLVADQRTDIEQLLQGSGVINAAPRDQLILGTSSSKTLLRGTPVQPDLQHRVFDSRVEMKVAVSQYAMHLSPEIRQKLFHDLDDVVNIDDWYEEDTLPRYDSFRDFLKWTIYSKRFNWTSIGISENGNILVAWKNDRALLTANFDGKSRVLWTVRRESPEGGIHAAGDSPLQFFEKEASLYLG